MRRAVARAMDEEALAAFINCIPVRRAEFPRIYAPCAHSFFVRAPCVVEPYLIFFDKLSILFYNTITVRVKFFLPFAEKLPLINKININYNPQTAV